jgi:hypothetical protein
MCVILPGAIHAPDICACGRSGASGRSGSASSSGLRCPHLQPERRSSSLAVHTAAFSCAQMKPSTTPASSAGPGREFARLLIGQAGGCLDRRRPGRDGAQLADSVPIPSSGARPGSGVSPKSSWTGPAFRARGFVGPGTPQVSPGRRDCLLNGSFAIVPESRRTTGVREGRSVDEVQPSGACADPPCGSSSMPEDGAGSGCA